MFWIFSNIVQNIEVNVLSKTSLRIGKHRIIKKTEHRPPLARIRSIHVLSMGFGIWDKLWFKVFPPLHMYHKMHRLPPSRYDNKSWGNGYSPPWFSKTCSAQGKYPASSEQRSQPTQIIWVFPDTTLLKLLLFTEFQSLIQASIRQIYLTLSQTDLCGDYALLSRHGLCRTNMLLSRIMSWHNLCSEYALFGVCFVQTLTQI